METEGIQQLATDDSIKRLKLILESGQNRPLSLEEVRSIAYDLVSFFELLAEGSDG